MRNGLIIIYLILGDNMQIVTMKDKKLFAIAGISFAELKTIKDACGMAGKQGLTNSTELYNKIEKLMEEITI